MDAGRLRARIRTYFAPKARHARFVVLAFKVPWGFTPEAYRAACERSKHEGAAWWDFINPRSMIIYFASVPAGEERARRCRSALEGMSAEHECMQGLRVGQAEGSLLATFHRGGRVASTPMGGVSMDAQRRMA